jgi:hypothetical protein
MRYFVFLLLAAFNVSAFAAATCTYYLMDGGGTTTSASAACQSQLPYYRGQFPSLNVEFTGTSGTPPSGCNFKVTGDNGYVYAEPSSSLRYTTKECEDTVCKSQQGQDFTLNWSLGYTRTPDIDADLNWKFVAPPVKPPSNGLVCDPVSSCKVALVLAPTAVWQSLSPTSQGLYRVSVDYDAQHMGETCTPTPAESAAAHPAADKPTCPGFVGEVNGVVGCYGTASNPTSNDVSESKPKPPEAGNPPAGKKPDSGEGSGTGGAGRTPSTGDGGPGGGPAAAAGSGTKPDGTTPKPDEGKEQANCGAPGQPKCGIDEGGTPNKFEGDKAALDKWKSDVDANRNIIKDAGGSFFESYSMFFAVPPIVPCEPIELPNDQVLTRQCDVVEGTRSVMSYIWALAAIWICLGWIREAI